MSKREKLRRKLREHPADADMHDVHTLLFRFGFSLARTRGSHYIFEYEEGSQFQQIIVPLHGHKVKRVYIRQVIAILDELFPPEEAAPEEEGDDESDQDD